LAPLRRSVPSGVRSAITATDPGSGAVAAR
jgi:hypothetical protein